MADLHVNTSDILRHLAVRSSTKDSLLIAWKVANEFTGFVHGYRVRYQAVGSAIVQDSPFLPSSTTLFDITHLHENTFYDVCLTIFTNMTSRAESCLTAATSTHSLSVALGSTFGAFLALGVVVMFVLLAKWQHFRRNRRLFQQHILTADSTESIDDLYIIQEKGDIELNCVEMSGTGNVEPDVGQRKEGGSSPTSEFSADVILHGASVCSVDHGPGSACGDPNGRQRVLIGLDGCACANSFILTSPSRDSKTGVSYSLLVPLSASGVLPFLVQQDHAQGQDQEPCGREESSVPAANAASRPGLKLKHQHPVVRLKLRKHPTVDCGSPAEEDLQHRIAQVQQRDVVDHVDQSRILTDVPLNTTTEAEYNASGGDDTEATSSARPCLLRSETGSETLPRSLSNTW